MTSTIWAVVKKETVSTKADATPDSPHHQVTKLYADVPPDQVIHLLSCARFTKRHRVAIEA